MSGILETLKFLDVTWLHVAVAVDKRLETQAARIAELEAALQDAARVLHKAGEQFTAYANQHAAKGTAGGDQKAATNQQWAQRCFNAHDAALEGGKKDE